MSLASVEVHALMQEGVGTLLPVVQHGEVEIQPMWRIRFTVPGEPTTWARAAQDGRRKNRCYQDDDQAWACALIYHAYMRAVEPVAREYDLKIPGPGAPWLEGVIFVADAYFPRPKTRWRWTPWVKPDWDNIGKLGGDALNGYPWRDDAQIIDGRVRKHYGEPRTEVEILLCLDPPRPSNWRALCT